MTDHDESPANVTGWIAGADAACTYSPERSTAIHEAGHAVMAYLLGRPFTTISVVEDAHSYGRVLHRAPGEWFRPDIEINARTRTMIEDRVMICLAGAATEEAWWSRQPGAPEGWRELVDRGAADDLSKAVDLADHMGGGSPPETEAYIEWLRQRVLGYTGRGPEFDVAAFIPDPMPSAVRHYREGNERFWSLVVALADALQANEMLHWRQARAILRGAEPAPRGLPRYLRPDPYAAPGEVMTVPDQSLSAS